MKIKKIAFIGAGSMAEAIIAGMIHSRFLEKEQIFVNNKGNSDRLDELQNIYHVTCSADKKSVIMDADVVVYATKPYDIQTAIHRTKHFIQEDQLIISVVAGFSTSFLKSAMEKDVAIIRAMPNTSATIGHSATAIAKGTYATDEQVATAKNLFQAIGTTAVVNEEDMHVVTGISGSGPAYVYYLAEAMEKAAIDEGLDPDTAKQLITQTILGAGNMLEKQDEPASALRDRVTSPNGTTAAGVQTLKDYHFHEAVEACVKNATSRSIALGSKK